jgi:putative ABC transport system substrate-binding protein
LQIYFSDVRNPSDIEHAFAVGAQDSPSAVYAMPDLLTFRHGPLIARLAAKHRLPVVFEFREPVEAGGLVSYGPDLVAMARYAAAFVDRLFRGAKPGDLPIEQPTKFELVINLKTAKALGLTVPPSLLVRADHVIE